MSRFLTWFAAGLMATWLVSFIVNREEAVGVFTETLQAALLALIGAGVWRKPPPLDDVQNAVRVARKAVGDE